METKSHYVLVGGVTLLLLAVLAGFTVWLSRIGDGAKTEYDIFFQQSVSGIAKGSGVTFAGVPVGQVKDIKLWRPDPDFVRVRIAIDSDTAILQGTTATISGIGFTGVSEIQLDGAIKGAPAIVCPAENPKSECPAGRPVIPTKPGALGEILNSAPLLVERLSTLTERLNIVLSDKNQQSIEQILNNVENLSGSLATQAPDLRAAIQESRATLAKAGAAAEQLTALSANANTLLDNEGKPMMAELRKTLRSANGSLSALETSLNSANPALETLNTQTLPEINQLARDLRRLSSSLQSVTERLDQQGVGGLVSAPKLPDYEPGRSK
ncbi:MCE family protein [Sphingorhabdus pulchriflava]|uniref:MCE family protein n=1 Tax=Sphingorhabdus pulchriflava TaxID=2292257 RepID=A0A371BF06_9SPHN|nr:MlaD family protein [Sphingorhabdus pulchriflava]RDV06097.1 MCE family protein [Sphingorhabdus pulchriflava]